MTLCLLIEIKLYRVLFIASLPNWLLYFVFFICEDRIFTREQMWLQMTELYSEQKDLFIFFLNVLL